MLFRSVMVALNEPSIEFVPLAEAVGRLRTVPVDSDTVLTARELGIAFGDEPTSGGAPRS